MKTIRDFITEYEITATVSSVDANPNMDSETAMDHWRVVLKRPGAKMTVYFSKGTGHHGKPAEAAEVLDCLASDANTIEETEGFEEWAANLGYDTDSRKAYRLHKIYERQAIRLMKFLGSAAYDELRNDVERL